MENKKKLTDNYKEILDFERLPIAILNSEVYALSIEKAEGGYEINELTPNKVRMQLYGDGEFELTYSPHKPISKCFE